MKSLRRKVLFPDLLSVSLAVLVGLIVAFLANAGTFFASYGYGSSANLVNESTHNVLINFLQRIDSFTLTDTIVTFLLWSVVGLFILLLLQTISHAYGAVKAELDIAGADYIKPSNVQRSTIFVQILFDILFLILGVVVFLLIAALFFGLALPYANELIRQLATSHNVANFVSATFGLAITCLGVSVLLYVARLTIRRHYFLPS